MFHREKIKPQAPSPQEETAPGQTAEGGRDFRRSKVLEQGSARNYTHVDPKENAPLANENITGPVSYDPAPQQNHKQVQPVEKKEPQEINTSPNQPQDNKQNDPAQAGRTDIPGGNFQPHGQNQSGGARGGYPGAYPGMASAQSGPQGANDSSSGNRLVIGKGITMSGEIEACEHLVVEGTVEAALKGASILEIADTGAFYGTVEIDEATVAGRFEGDLTVKGLLTIRSGGSITGAIAYKELAVEAGATLDGRVSPLESKSDASAPRKVISKGNKKQESGNELPFADKVVAAAE